VNSRTREIHKNHFRPWISEGAAKYAWFGTEQQFDALTFLFVETEHGKFSVHAYPSDGRTSTFIVETDETSWLRAGLNAVDAASLAPGESDELARAYCEAAFAEHLGGHGLLVNNSKWLNFRTVENATWSMGNVALLGDAAHTAHFSVGSGTKMAMEDAIALAASVDESGATPQALEQYEGWRRPAVERIQAAARPSQAWWEDFGRHMRLAPERFVYHFLTRNPRLTHEGLKVRDYRFVRTVEAWFERETASRPEDERAIPAPALSMPLGLRGLVLPNRVSTAPATALKGGAEERRDERLARVVGAALWGAGLVAVSGSELLDEVDVRVWRDLSDLVHGRSEASLSLLVETAGLKEVAETVRRADEAGFDVLEFLDTGGLLGREVLGGEGAGERARQVIATVAQVREAWPEDKPIVVHLEVFEDVGGWEAAVELARKLKESGCDAVAVSSVGAVGDSERRIAQLNISDRVRNEAGLTTMLVGGVPGDDEAVTAVLSGRADLCRGTPSLASPIWGRKGDIEQGTGEESLAVAGEAGGSAPS
jgi:anthraniloyl-CoA monooxygenase